MDACNCLQEQYNLREFDFMFKRICAWSCLRRTTVYRLFNIKVTDLEVYIFQNVIVH